MATRSRWYGTQTVSTTAPISNKPVTTRLMPICGNRRLCFSLVVIGRFLESLVQSSRDLLTQSAARCEEVSSRGFALVQQLWARRFGGSNALMKRLVD